MRTIIVLATLVSACAVSTESQSTSELCTEEDQQAGLCDSPWGGWTPPYDEASAYTADQIAQQGWMPQQSACSSSSPSGNQWAVTCVAWGASVALTCSFVWELQGNTIELVYANCIPSSHVAPIARTNDDPGLCTQEDQDAGLCDGPAGGWTALAALLDTRGYAQEQGVDVSYETTHNCTTDRCVIRIELPGAKIVADCHYNDAGSRQVCHTFSCPTWSVGYPCTGAL